MSRLNLIRRWSRALPLSVLALIPLAPVRAVVAEQSRDSVPVAAALGDHVRYRTTEIEGVEIFYREAGPANAPAIVLLHGFPTSSNMFRNLIPVLGQRYRVIAPDYPGFGQSAVPAREQFEYSFAHYARLVDGLLSRLRVDRYALYVMDYGAGRISSGAPASGARDGARRSEWQCVCGRPRGSILGSVAQVLGERLGGRSQRAENRDDARGRS
jgi:hypothetical protein